ncbi:thioredoxin family protein [Leucobacter weissii]|uniref:Thioredoxin family protein n=1 Tax=Leucobacter weissii TaxID=1983706 RepID=A0A939MM77_9MICO|nr:thioredoxin family protein [Leucobacter weissii]MBO1901367.1 thioredoxin family protein [Leucobacter weissii]
MTPIAALGLVLALLAVAAVVGWLLARRGPRVRALDAGDGGEGIDPHEFGAEEFGLTGTVVQFSTVYCTRCPATRRTISQLVEHRPGVDFVHVDVTDQPDLASKYRLTQTPTVLILDGAGVARTRLSGTIDRATLTRELDTTIGGTR